MNSSILNINNLTISHVFSTPVDGVFTLHCATHNGVPKVYKTRRVGMGITQDFEIRDFATKAEAIAAFKLAVAALVALS